MVERVRFTLFQLVALLTAAAATLAFFNQDESRKRIWTEFPLVYAIQDVPENYLEQRGPLNGYCRLFPNATFNDGETLFRKAHRRGWDVHRYHFCSGLDLYKNSFEINRSLEDIDFDQDGVDTAGYLAYATGYNDCNRAVDELLKTRSKSELQESLSYSRLWHDIPILVIAVGSILCFVISFVRSRK